MARVVHGYPLSSFSCSKSPDFALILVFIFSGTWQIDVFGEGGEEN
jgi:hypothetical protein